MRYRKEDLLINRKTYRLLKTTAKPSVYQATIDDESRLKYLRDQHKSKEDMAEDEKGMKVMAFCFCAVCLFGHLAESPVSDTWNAYVEWVRPSGAE